MGRRRSSGSSATGHLPVLPRERRAARAVGKDREATRDRIEDLAGSLVRSLPARLVSLFAARGHGRRSGAVGNHVPAA